MNSFFFINAVKNYHFKSNDPDIKPYLLYLGNISKDFTLDRMKKSWLKRSIKIISIFCNAIDTSNILDIHRYLMKEISDKSNAWTY